MGDETGSQIESVSGGAADVQEEEAHIDLSGGEPQLSERDRRAVGILAELISQRTRSESPQVSQKQQDATLHRPEFEDDVKEPFIQFIKELQKSARPLTFLCKENVEPLYMDATTAPNYVSQFTIEDNAPVARVDNYLDAEDRQQKQQEEDDFVGNNGGGGGEEEEEEEQQQDEPPQEGHIDDIGSGLLEYNPLSGGVEQFWAVSYQLAEIYQYFQYFDKTNEALYPVARTKAYLMMLETIKKNSLNSELVKSQFATVMMLPPFLSAK